MGKSQRTKGASYEREVCAAFSRATGREIKRNIGQARDGGNDIDLGRFVVECKRRKTLTTIEGWFKQAVAACRGRPEKIPVVVARSDNGRSLVIIALENFLEIMTGDALLTGNYLTSQEQPQTNV